MESFDESMERQGLMLEGKMLQVLKVGIHKSKSRVMQAIGVLLTTAPIPDSDVARIPSYERDYSILLHEHGQAHAEAVMANIYVFEVWRRSRAVHDGPKE